MRHQLSARQARWLDADSAHSNANLSLLHIFDPATATGGVVRFKAILAQIENRLGSAALFRQRLQAVPLGLDRAYWVDDERFDLEYHVRHIALPKPGDWRQFCIQASRIHARGLDLERPLWEAYVIEGLDSFLDLPVGSFALLLKTHRAAVEGLPLAAIGGLLFDPGAKPPAQAPAAAWLAEPAPSALTLIACGLAQSLAQPSRLARPWARALSRAAPTVTALARELWLRPHTGPVTRFNSVVSPHRVVETRRFTEAEFDAVRGLVPGATVQHVVLAVCGGALRHYLNGLGELPATGSVSVQVEGDRAGAAAGVAAGVASDAAQPGARGRVFALGTDIADPLERLTSICQQAAAAAAQAGSAPLAACSLTELAGPSAPQFLCGARLSYFSAVLPISDGQGLAFAVSHCDGKLVISLTSCRELMPDPEVFAQCLRDSFQTYAALALALALELDLAHKPASVPHLRRACAAPTPAGPAAIKRSRAVASTSGRPSRARRPA